MNDVEAREADAIPVEIIEVDEKEVLRQSIERNEAELREAVEELTAAVKSEVSLGAHIVEHPWAWLFGGFVFGVLMARR